MKHVNQTKIDQRQRGLSDEQVYLSRREHGNNTISTRPAKSFLRQLLENLGDPVIRILLVALLVNLVFVFRGGDVLETVGIGVSVLLATLISTLSERGSERAFRRLSAECARASYRVRRNGAIVSVGIDDIVVGDVILVEAGEQIPADGWIISGKLSVDQSAMTGESRETEKSPHARKSLEPSSQGALLRGCLILAGEGEMVVERVGDATLLGHISGELQAQTRQSPLKVRLTVLARQISRIGYVAAVLVALADLFHGFVMESGYELPIVMMKLTHWPYVAEQLLHALMLSLTIIVVAVPERLKILN